MNLRTARAKRASTVKESVIWGAIVGIALGVMVTFALARGVLALPWQVEAQEHDHQTRTSLSPAWSPTSQPVSQPVSRAAEPRRPARPEAEASVDPSHRSLSRS